MATLVAQDLDFDSVARITNLPDAASAQQPVTLAQLNALSEGLAWKDNVRAASTANVNLSSPGSSMDGISLTTSDRILVKDQSTASQNGIYIWNGASTAATRATDASTFDELESAVVTVDEGTANGGSTWRQTAVNGTIGSNDVTWTSFGATVGAATETSAGKAELATQAETNAGSDDARIVTPLKLANYTGFAKKYSASIGDGSNTSLTVTHNLGTRDVVVEVFRNSGNYDKIIVETRHATTNTVDVVFASAPTSNQFRVVVTG
jgi:hypothetical protein